MQMSYRGLWSPCQLPPCHLPEPELLTPWLCGPSDRPSSWCPRLSITFCHSSPSFCPSQSQEGLSTPDHWAPLKSSWSIRSGRGLGISTPNKSARMLRLLVQTASNTEAREDPSGWSPAAPHPAFLHDNPLLGCLSFFLFLKALICDYFLAFVCLPIHLHDSRLNKPHKGRGVLGFFYLLLITASGTAPEHSRSSIGVRWLHDW